MLNKLMLILNIAYTFNVYPGDRKVEKDHIISVN